jgi:hypothetical protein
LAILCRPKQLPADSTGETLFSYRADQDTTTAEQRLKPHRGFSCFGRNRENSVRSFSDQRQGIVDAVRSPKQARIRTCTRQVSSGAPASTLGQSGYCRTGTPLLRATGSISLTTSFWVWQLCRIANSYTASKLASRNASASPLAQRIGVVCVMPGSLP